MVACAVPDALSEIALTLAEIGTLDQVVPNKTEILPAATPSTYLAKVARLGGYLARTRDPPPGNTVMWRGWAQLADIMTSAELAE